MLYTLAYLEELTEKDWNACAAFGALYLYEMGFSKDISFNKKICAMIGLLNGGGSQPYITNGDELLWVDEIFKGEYKNNPVKDERSLEKYLSSIEKKLANEFVNSDILPQGFETVFGLPKIQETFATNKTLGEYMSFFASQGTAEIL